MRLLLHSIAFGNLKLIAPEAKREETARAALAGALGIDEARLGEAVDRLFAEGVDALAGLTAPPEYPAAAFIEEEDLQQTIHAMGTSLLGWVQDVHRRGLFAPDARVVGLTSEGNEVAWKGYAAVAAAKVALESISRAIAVEMAPYGIRSNIVQAGVTDTPALRLIPGNAHLKAAARRRNPFGSPDDAGGRGPGDPPAVPAGGGLDQRRGHPGGRRRARLGGLAVSLYLHGLGHFHPEVEITNRFLEDLDIGTTDAWILERVGIRARRTLLPLDYIRDTRNRDPRMSSEAQLYGNAETGRRAAEMAIARAGIDRRDIGMVISGSSAPDMVTPADACTIAAALGLEVPCFDVNSACTSFHVAMHLLSMMDPEKVPRFVLSVVPEGVTRTVDYSDRTAAVLWGDGTAAAVLSTREPGRARILGNTLESSPAGHDKVTIPRQGHFLQEGRTVQMFAIKKTVKCYRHLRERLRPGRATAPLRRPPGQPDDAAEGVRAVRGPARAAPPQREGLRQHRRRRLGRRPQHALGRLDRR